MNAKGENIFFIQKSDRIYFIQGLVFILFILLGAAQQDMKNYGPYALSWRTFDTCKGPKQKDCGKVEIKNSQNMSDIIFDVDFPVDCPATMGKIIVSTKNNNVTKKLWNYGLNYPCEHFVLGPILVDSFNLTKNCKVNKGQYEIHLDLKTNSVKFLGRSFFYGTYTFQIVTYNKLSNFFCVSTDFDVKKP